MMKTSMIFAFALLLISSISAAILDKTEEVSSKFTFSEATDKAEPSKCKKHHKPMDCQDVMENGNTESGVYTIWPRSRISKCRSIEVYCDMETAGGGWTVIQRRGNYGNAQNYFDKTWNDYKAGFGNLNREFWLGNENILAITNQAQYAIRFDLKQREGKSAFAVYESFWIDDESQKYKLHLRDYSGTAGDALTPQSEKDFYTKDQPNWPPDVKTNGTKHTGGWWYNRFTSSNLNALNNNGEKLENVKLGMSWQPFGDYRGVIVFSEIKVRSKDF